MVRERLSQALDEAYEGQPVFIERRGVTYRLSVERPEPAAKRAAARKPYIEVLDPAIEAGEWTLEWRPEGVRFKGRRRTR